MMNRRRTFVPPIMAFLAMALIVGSAFGQDTSVTGKGTLSPIQPTPANGSSIDYSPASPGIANGSFENPNIDPCNPPGFITRYPGGDLTDWTIGGHSIDHICNYWVAPEGDQSIDLTGLYGGSVAQGLTGLDDGHTYKVTFMLAGNPDPSEADLRRMQIDVDGASGTFDFDVETDCDGPCSYGNMGWVERSFEFTATGATADLVFTGLIENYGWGPALDDVKLFFGNHAPVVNDDTYDAVENTQLVVAAPGVLANDTDADDDPLTAANLNDPSNGTLDEFLSDGSFKYIPDDGYCGADILTYAANDNYDALSSEATVTINVACRPDITSVDPNAQTVDYSDAIATVTIIAEDGDSHPLTLSTVNPLPAFLEITGGCTARGATPADGTDCEWYLDSKAPEHVYVPAQIFDIGFVATDPEGNTNTCSDETECAHVLTVEPEDADVTLDPSNPIDLNNGEGGAELILRFQAVELLPDNAVSGGAFPGDLTNMSGSGEITLFPVGPGTLYGTYCDLFLVEGVGYGQIAYFECDLSNLGVNVNTYEIVAKVDNDYYYGRDEGVLVVYDPALGFTTGGGFFFWPDTAVPECLEYVEDECIEENLDPCAGWIGDKTNFGFSFKYNKKMTNIQGNLLMMRHTCDGGNWKVKSNMTEGMSIGAATDGDDEYGWAAVSGKATFRDPTDHNTGANAFLLYVEDHGDQGCSQDPSDAFWLTVLADNIWPDPLPEDPAAEDGSDAGDVEIFCGNIVVPHAAPGKGKK